MYDSHGHATAITTPAALHRIAAVSLRVSTRTWTTGGGALAGGLLASARLTPAASVR